MEIEERLRFLVIENGMARSDISAPILPGYPRCCSMPSCWVSMLRDVRIDSSLYLLSGLNRRCGEAYAKDEQVV
jgi:hypothetical protein